jgi:ATP-dependent Clp protease ATP-binding subunit ClpX
LNPLDRETLRRILIEPKNAILKQFKRLFEIDGIELIISDEAIEFIVDKAVEFKLGARGLRSICEAILNDSMFELPSQEKKDKLEIDQEYVSSKLGHMTLKKLKAVS